MKKIKAFIVNRNLISSLKNAVNFLLKEPRIEIVIFDQQSTYPPLLEYYNNSGVTVVYSSQNNGPHSVWGDQLRPYFNDNYFIIADSDCLYDDVPNDWLDKMINVLENTDVFKVGFSLDISDLPETEIGRQAREWESKYWINRKDIGWDAHIDTTFALYRPFSGFAYDALRLDKPYCIKHTPWYLTDENITDEWKYYLNTAASSISCWGTKLKSTINMSHKVNKGGLEFNVQNTPVTTKFWLDHYSWWEQSTFDFIVPKLDKNKTFIDIGSWIGPISLVASKYSKNCICFEPDPVAHAEFVENIKLNNISNIILEDKAVSTKTKLQLGSAVLGESITRDSATENLISVDCISIKEILEKYNLSESNISVIKIDVEGHEQELLKEKSVLWDLNVPMHISFHPGWKEDQEQFYIDVIPFLNYKGINTDDIKQRGNFFDISFE